MRGMKKNVKLNTVKAPPVLVLQVEVVTEESSLSETIDTSTTTSTTSTATIPTTDGSISSYSAKTTAAASIGMVSSSLSSSTSSPTAAQCTIFLLLTTLNFAANFNSRFFFLNVSFNLRR